MVNKIMDKYKIDSEYRLKFYHENLNMVNYMRRFLDKQEKGTLCRCLLVDEHKNVKGDIIPGGFYYTDKLKSGYAFTNRIDEWSLKNSITIHYYSWVYSKGIFDNVYINDVHKHVIGVRPTIDIDAPYDEELSKKLKKKTRVDILFDDKYIEDAKETIKLIIKELNDVDDKTIPIKFIIQFSGNGFYIRLDKNFYGSESDISIFDDKWVELKRNVNHETGFDNIDIRRGAWNRFYKVPFTFHSYYNRLSINLPENFNLDYLLKHSNPDNYHGGKII